MKYVIKTSYESVEEYSWRDDEYLSSWSMWDASWTKSISGAIVKNTHQEAQHLIDETHVLMPDTMVTVIAITDKEWFKAKLSGK